MIPLIHADLRAGACRQWGAALDAPQAERLANCRRKLATTSLPDADLERTARYMAEAPPALPGECGGWSVYRIAFADGAAYVGITSGSVADRLAQHLGLADSLDFDAPAIQGRRPGRGSAQVLWRAAAGIRYRFRVLASGLDERQARDLEDAAVRRLRRPLNATSNARRWRDSATAAGAARTGPGPRLRRRGRRNGPGAVLRGLDGACGRSRAAQGLAAYVADRADQGAAPETIKRARHPAVERRRGGFP